SELGLDPGPELAQVQAKVLADDPSLAAPADAMPGGAQPPVLAGPADESWQNGAKAADPGDPIAPRQLPAVGGYFAGRDSELKALDELVGHPGGSGGHRTVAAVGGMAGVGKTTLAVHWAQKVADRFPDGQLYVDMRGYDPDGTPVPAAAVTGWFLAALGVPGAAIPAEAQARAGLYRSVLADRRVLIVRDKGGAAGQVGPLVAGGPGCLTVVTSRSSLAGLAATDGARLVRLGVLDEHGAMRLLEARLGPERVAAEPAAVADLIRLCA